MKKLAKAWKDADINEKVRLALCGVLISLTVLLPMLLMNKGIDITDVGHMLSGYHFAFSDRLSISLGTGLSEVVGGIIVKLFPSCPLLALQIMLWLSYIAVGAIVYMIFRCRLDTLSLLAAIFAGSMFYRKFAFTLGYNALSSITLVVGILLLLRALQKDNKYLLAVSGVVFALNALFRLPNILEMAMVAVVFWYYVHADGAKKAFLRSAMFLSCVAALGVVFVIYYGIDDLFEDIMHYVALGSEGSHGIVNMLADQIRGYAAGALWCVIYFLPPLALAAGYAIAKGRWGARISKYAASIEKYAPLCAAAYSALFAAIFYIAHGCVRDSILNVRVIYGITTAAAALAVYCAVRYRRTDRDFAAISAASLVGMVTFPIGTDNGIMINHCIAALIIAYLVAAVCKVFDAEIAPRMSQSAVSVRHSATALLLGIAIVSGVCFAVTYAYRDDLVARLDTPVESAPLTGMRTTPERAQAIEELIEAAEPYADSERELLILGSFPLAHVLLDMKPFVGTDWPDRLAFSPEDFNSRLAQKEQEGVRPLIIVTLKRTDNITGDMWPDTSARNWELNGKYCTTMDFISRNDYSEVYRSDNYIIYAPNDSLGGEVE